MPASLQTIRQQCASQLLALYRQANAGHIGSSLSCLEILVDLCFQRMGAEDVVILSKGHAAAALYTTLSLSGRMPEARLESFYQDGTLLAAHPPCSGAIAAIPFGTGSLGHGLSLAAGTAFSQRFTGRKFQTYAILSDGDCNEGATWEAALFAAHHQLANLTAIIDLNGLQGIGHTRDILNLEPIADKWRAFGFAVAVADDGNDFASLARAHAGLAGATGPRCLIARTIKGHGVSYMQDKMEWHYLPMNDAQYEEACRENLALAARLLTMRKEFSQWIEDYGRRDPRLIFLTGDLGFQALEKVQAVLGPRFVNAGVSEQNMVSLAAGLARQGLHPLCYSIAPFAVFRPYEQTRLDVALHNLPVKIVGNGGGYGYGIMGASHHALEDLAVLSCLPNFACVVPLCNSDVAGSAEALFRHAGPGYLRLGLGLWPEQHGALPAFQPMRLLLTARGDRPRLTVAGIGPVLLNVLAGLPAGGVTEVFAVAQLPLPALPEAFIRSVRATGQLLVVEEHAARGGLGEHLAAALAREGVACTLHHRHAAGYPTGHYGSQAWHQQQSGLDPASLQATVARLTS